MTDWPWKDEYRALVRSGRDRGELEIRRALEERRAQPRFKLKSECVWIKVEPKFAVVDVSVTGIALYSDFPFEVGKWITITLGKAFSVEAEVRGCEVVESDPTLLEHKYLVRCGFEDEETGMKFLVMIKEMDNLELVPGSAGG